MTQRGNLKKLLRKKENTLDYLKLANIETKWLKAVTYVNMIC